ncbi:MAG: pyridoxal-phosphate dependent enzyme, partial [Planctomycetia bacterium]
GVWRFHELLPFAPRESVVTIGEGQTMCPPSDGVAAYTGVRPGRLFLQYEGLNPSGSFKDNGMSAAFTHARMIGARRAACASTGNTSASLAVYCAVTRLMRGIIFIGSGKISYGKLSQALDYGTLTIQIAGDFDDAMARVKEVSGKLGIYLVNSVNPFRLEGQKTIMFRVLESLGWEVPDWIVVPGGNLGNSSAFGKAFAELRKIGLIDRVPRLAVINAAGANTLHELYTRREREQLVEAPDAAEGERIAAAHPLPLEKLERVGRPQPVPVVLDVEQAAAGRTGREDLVDRERGAARRRDALLKREIGAGGDGHRTALHKHQRTERRTNESQRNKNPLAIFRHGRAGGCGKSFTSPTGQGDRRQAPKD